VSAKRAPRILAAIIGIFALSAQAAQADEGWKECSHKDGVIVEKRPVPGSRFVENRARGHIAMAPADVLERIWAGVPHEYPPTVTKRTLLSQSPNEMLIYDQIHTPVVSDRDLTTRLHKIADPQKGLFEIRFEGASEAGPPPNPHYVRLTTLRGLWHIESDGGSGSNVSYQVYSEPGGSVPAFLVRGTLQDETMKELERVVGVLNRAKVTH
jgi:hypothetical protein